MLHRLLRWLNKSRAGPLKVFVVIVALTACGEARVEPVILSCWGTVALVQESKQVNPKDERFSLVITVDVAKKTLTVDDGAPWPLSDDTSRTTIVAMSLGKGHATRNAGS